LKIVSRYWSFNLSNKIRFFFSATALFLSGTNLERIDKQSGSLYFFNQFGVLGAGESFLLILQIVNKNGGPFDPPVL
jgi:hypothetical protein